MVSGLDPLHLANLGGSSVTPDFQNQLSVGSSNFKLRGHNTAGAAENMKIQIISQDSLVMKASVPTQTTDDLDSALITALQ